MVLSRLLSTFPPRPADHGAARIAVPQKTPAAAPNMTQGSPSTSNERAIGHLSPVQSERRGMTPSSLVVLLACLKPG